MPIYSDCLMMPRTYEFYQLFEDDPAWSGIAYEDKYHAFAAANEAFGLGIADVDSDSLLDLLYLKFAYSHIRYTDVNAFLVALFRELQYSWTLYKSHITLYASMEALTVAQIQKDGLTVRNVINNPNVSVTTPSETPIPSLSTEQETLNTTSNALDACIAKYSALKRNAREEFWKPLIPLFSVMLTEDDVDIIPQED